MNIKEIKKALNLNDSQIAEAFGYKSAMTYRNSSGKKKLEAGLEWFFKIVNSEDSTEGKKT